MEKQKILKGLKCKNCGRLYMHPKYICSDCGNEVLGEVNLKGTGEVFSYTTIRVPPLGLEDQAPYDLILVRLDEGINITGRVAKGGDEAEIKIGKRAGFVESNGLVNYFEILS